MSQHMWSWYLSLYQLLRTGSTQKDPSGHNWIFFAWDIKNQIKQTNTAFLFDEAQGITHNVYVSQTPKGWSDTKSQWAATRDFQQCGMCNHQSLRSNCAYAQADLRLWWSLEYFMSVKLLTEHHLKFLSLKGGCTGLPESIHVKMPHWWKSRVAAQINWNIAFCIRHTALHIMCMWAKHPKGDQILE